MPVAQRTHDEQAYREPRKGNRERELRFGRRDLQIEREVRKGRKNEDARQRRESGQRSQQDIPADFQAGLRRWFGRRHCALGAAHRQARAEMAVITAQSL